MKATKGPWRYLFLGAMLAGMAARTEAQQMRDSPEMRATLRGVRAVHVVHTTGTSDILEQAGLGGNILTDTELTLREAGIRVVPAQETPGEYLEVELSCVAAGDCSACEYKVEYHQPVLLLRDQSNQSGKQARIIDAPTWGVARLVFLASSPVRDMRGYVKDWVREFANAYLEQNPTR